MREDKALLEAVCAAARDIAARGLVLGSGGNVSVRVGDVIYISARGAVLETLTPDQLVPVSLEDGKPLREGRPSSELPMHRACYLTRPEARAVIHCHPPHAIALSTVRDALPALTPEFFLYMHAAQVPVVPYHTPGTEVLAAAVAEALRRAPAAVLANHGLIAVGETPEEALKRVLQAEETARMYLLASTLGSPRVLTEADWAALRAAGYNIPEPQGGLGGDVGAESA